ncbi:hypothetical protein K443DRAFT_544232 [Laccaria amethystina LaAM-08-1]|uniref:Uncharacterized protein n=1 Tax=Laccaria amethystina LaAM-08-1 TaxID=1095629 RepID=A0A0C9WLP9_9AGAR|nr:hypothetical protein K443DRAFT_544232 [Laccaria amethystina LaAM-08-1]
MAIHNSFVHDIFEHIALTPRTGTPQHWYLQQGDGHPLGPCYTYLRYSRLNKRPEVPLNTLNIANPLPLQANPRPPTASKASTKPTECEAAKKTARAAVPEEEEREIQGSTPTLVSPTRRWPSSAAS